MQQHQRLNQFTFKFLINERLYQQTSCLQTRIAVTREKGTLVGTNIEIDILYLNGLNGGAVRQIGSSISIITNHYSHFTTSKRHSLEPRRRLA